MQSIGDNLLLLYKAEKLSVCLSVRLHFWHADNSAVCALIERNLLEMKAVSLKNTKFSFTSLQNPQFIDMSV